VAYAKLRDDVKIVADAGKGAEKLAEVAESSWVRPREK
jgi:hypothetical protein